MKGKTFIENAGKHYPLVIVKWLDSGRNTDWHWIDDSEPSYSECISVGFLIKENKYAVCIYPHIADAHNKSFQGVGSITIPKKSIVSRECLKTAKNYAV